VPIIVGGTGQYVWALLEGWRVPRVPPNHDLRAQLEQLAGEKGAPALLSELQRIDPVSASTIDRQNMRRIIRAIEVTLATGRPFSEWRHRDPPALMSTVLGLSMERRSLYERLDRRVEQMMQSGLLDEVRGLIDTGYPCSFPAMSSIGYRQLCDYLAGRLTFDQAVARIKTETHRLARMQHAWFKPSDARIQWLDATSPNLLDNARAALSAPNGVALS
jgi:tRNA dimethylallyltransferase